VVIAAQGGGRVEEGKVNWERVIPSKGKNKAARKGKVSRRRERVAKSLQQKESVNWEEGKKYRTERKKF